MTPPLGGLAPSSYIAEQVSSDDCQVLDIEVGSPNGQQVLEALSMLIALRAWSSRWQQWRSTVAVRGDNVTMLAMELHFKGTSPALNVIARELALEVAEAAYRPILAEHIPGVANVTAAALSRMHMPGGKYMLPDCLRGIPQASVPARPREW